LKNALNKFQSDLTDQKTITDVISEENQKIKKELDERGKELDVVKSELIAVSKMIKQIASSDSYREMTEGVMEQVADKLAKNPEFVEKFKKDSEKLKSGYIKPQRTKT